VEALLAGVAGVLLLIALAVIIGKVEANARDGAWQRIADARRDLHEREQNLLACLARPRCTDCPLRDWFGERP
jgi:hypothetical protein